MRLFATILVLILGAIGLLRADFAVGFDDFPLQRKALESKLAQDTNNVSVLVELGRLLHNEAALEKAHPKELVREAEKIFRRVLVLSPTNVYAQAMLGSTVVMTAREAFLPTTKIKTVRKGLEQIDAAVAAAPEDAHVRFTRASNNTFLPEFFHRRELVVADFEWLVARITAHPGDYEVELRQYVYLYYGVASQKFGDKEKARKLLETGLALDPKSKVAERLRSQLETLVDKKKK
ncbi:MAG TPA: hypothetical protein VMF06_08135 [Candidatus Limnocylindria bacterium]|jgi:tetratricopeptide (TPR) repeat protein|nr:hypothetical protein [Candidatus Limnocylindria bacterium]